MSMNGISDLKGMLQETRSQNQEALQFQQSLNREMKDFNTKMSALDAIKKSWDKIKA